MHNVEYPAPTLKVAKALKLNIGAPRKLGLPPIMAQRP